MIAPERLAVEYVLPLRWREDSGSAELSVYLRRLASIVDVTVVDGSPDPLFRAHDRAWGAYVRHLRPEPWPGGNGKVRGVMTGLRAARHEHVLLADDDVRHTPRTLARIGVLLERADLVHPQNVFCRWPWHAREDGARSLINRALGMDYAGTMGVRRSVVLRAGGYRGDVLFENLELIRTVAAAGGVVRWVPELFVDRLPPTARHFLAQRVRQAYDDLAEPARLLRELAMLPLAVVLARRCPVALPVLALAAVATAEAGRRRAGGRAVFPPSVPLWAPVWIMERAVAVWIALALRVVAGGVRYGDGRIRDAASSARSLRSRARS